jgi:dTMP kinase
VFITFEGIEGSGKSLQILRAQAYLQKRGVSCLVTREPGGTDFGLALRPILLGTGGSRREPLSELLLYLEQGLWVLSDRYQDATRAYQGAARGIPPTEIEKLVRLLRIIEPDKTILLDLDPEEGLSRARRRNRTSPTANMEGRFEAEDLYFHRRVRNAYLELARRSPGRIHIVEASGTPDEVFSRIAPLFDKWIPPSE